MLENTYSIDRHSNLPWICEKYITSYQEEFYFAVQKQETANKFLSNKIDKDTITFARCKIKKKY